MMTACELPYSFFTEGRPSEHTAWAVEHKSAVRIRIFMLQDSQLSQAPAARCTRKSPLPLLPSGPGGVGGNALRGTDALQIDFSICFSRICWCGGGTASPQPARRRRYTHSCGGEGEVA